MMKLLIGLLFLVLAGCAGGGTAPCPTPVPTPAVKAKTCAQMCPYEQESITYVK